MQIQNLKQLKEELSKSDELKRQLRENPEKFIQDLPDPRNDPKIFKSVLYIIASVLILSLIFMGVLVVINKDYTGANVPQFLITISSTALGALVGLLVPNSND